jgi:hypothetical protein
MASCGSARNAPRRICAASASRPTSSSARAAFADRKTRCSPSSLARRVRGACKPLLSAGRRGDGRHQGCRGCRSRQSVTALCEDVVA